MTIIFSSNFSGIEYWQNPDPASAANTVECAADGEDPNCSASNFSLGIDLAHTVVSLKQTLLRNNYAYFDFSSITIFLQSRRSAVPEATDMQQEIDSEGLIGGWKDYIPA